MQHLKFPSGIDEIKAISWQIANELFSQDGLDGSTLLLVKPNAGEVQLVRDASASKDEFRNLAMSCAKGEDVSEAVSIVKVNYSFEPLPDGTPAPFECFDAVVVLIASSSGIRVAESSKIQREGQKLVLGPPGECFMPLALVADEIAAKTATLH